jgi:hypothetical protein
MVSVDGARAAQAAEEHGVPPLIRRGGVRCSPSRRRHLALEETTTLLLWDSELMAGIY